MPTNRRLEQAICELYAKNLVNGLYQEGGIDALIAGRTQLDEVIAYNHTHVELGELANNQSYTPEQRSQAIRAILKNCEPALLSIFGVMVERGDFPRKLTKVRSLFNGMIVEQLNTTVVDVTTRVPLDDHLREVIKEKATRELGTNVVLDERIDESMLGGIIMNANGKRIDASMRTMLESARNVLKVN